MNVRSVAFLAVLGCAAFSVSCSDDPPPAVSGGAYYQLLTLTTPGSTLGRCLDPGAEVTIANRDADGSLKLIVDQADGAQVACKLDGGRFDVKVSNRLGTFQARGSYTGTTSTDTFVRLITGSGNVYETRETLCSLEITENADGKIFGYVTCPELQHTNIDAACEIGSTSKSYFRFANCTGF